MRTRPRIWKTLITLAACGTILAIAHVPTTIRHGTNYQWSTSSVYLYEKSVHFFSRDLRTRRLTAKVIDGASTPEQKLRKIFDWTIRNIHKTPVGFPVKDDHIQNVIIRGYGQPDQMAEVFALLASYGGFRAGTAMLHADTSSHSLILTVIEHQNDLYIFDMANGMMFERNTGHLATLKDLLADPSIVHTTANGLVVFGLPYEDFFSDLTPPKINPLRMKAQHPWQRLKMEFLKFFRISG